MATVHLSILNNIEYVLYSLERCPLSGVDYLYVSLWGPWTSVLIIKVLTSITPALFVVGDCCYSDKD